MKRFILNITVNDAKTGEYIETVGIYFEDTSNSYKTAKALRQDILTYPECWEFIVLNCRKTQPHADEVFSVQGVTKLYSKPDKEEGNDDDADEDE